MSSTKPQDITIAGLRGQDLAAFILMVENGSMPESIQDEFQMGRTQVASASEEVRIMAKNFGGLNKFRDAVEPVVGPKPLLPIERVKKTTATPTPNARIYKTSVGLRDVLFNTMEELRAGRIDVADAMGVCALSKEICSTVKLEMDAEKLRQSMPKGAEIGSLVLGSNADG